MKATVPFIDGTQILSRLLALAGFFWLTSTGAGADVPGRLDSFDSGFGTSLNTPRLIITDAGIGGSSTANPLYHEGILRVEGHLAPGRGQPAFVSLVLLLSPDGAPQDLSDYEGLEIRLRVLKGTVSVLAASSEIDNFDYHAAFVSRSRDFQVVRIPFKSLKRGWSEATPLNLRTITSINVVASGMQAGDFAYEIDSVDFYQK